MRDQDINAQGMGGKSVAQEGALKTRFSEGDNVRVSMDKNHGVEIGVIRKVDRKKGIYFIEFDETGVWDECEIEWVDKTGKRLDEEGYWISEDGKMRLNDYSVGKWVTFPNAKMTGKLRKIIGTQRMDIGDERDVLTYVCEAPELPEDGMFKRLCFDLRSMDRVSFGTKEDAEKYLRTEEAKSKKAAKHLFAEDAMDKGKTNIFDPEDFDQNLYEWGAIYWYNNIMDAIKKMDPDYVMPDEQFTEMVAPLTMAAKVYAEAQGKNKAWVKKTVLGVPKAFLNAFDTLSDGEGVQVKRLLKIFTLEGLCALVEGKIDSIHDLERFYDRKGEYADREGYKVGDWVVIEKNAPDKEVIHNIKRILAFRGEGKDAEAIFWNKGKTDIITRKLEDCSEPFPNFDAAADYATDENWAEDEDLEYTMYLGAILQSMGLGMDAGIDPSDPDFWMKHDRSEHKGHFDPNTMTCTLREKYKQNEAAEKRKDEEDTLKIEEPVHRDKSPKERAGGISQIFTGSAADYDKPSLLHVGEGEGSQVYGWGLYGSSKRSVGETYADISADENSKETIMKRGEPIKTEKNANAYEILSSECAHNGFGMRSINYDDVKSAVRTLESIANGKELGSQSLPNWTRILDIENMTSEEVQWYIDELKNHWDEYSLDIKRPSQVLYEQTFFTDRAPGDESHLLKWYERIPEEQLNWILQQAEKEGLIEKFEDEKKWRSFDGNFKQFITDNGRTAGAVYETLSESGLAHSDNKYRDTSEFLARAGIDGIKYPVDSYGGKGVKDGDKYGWNYVSFRDDNIRIDKKYVDGQKVFDYQALMAKRCPGVDAMEVLLRISKMGSPKEMENEFRRILKNGNIAEDSLNEILASAIEMAFVIGQDGGLNPNDPDFWMKHDRARHGGHFDPETQTCSLREQMGLPTAKNKGEREAQAERKDEEDMLGGESPSVVTVGVSKNSDKGKKRERLKNIIEATGRGVDADKFISLLAALPRESQVAAAARRLKANGNVKPQMRKITAQDFHKVISDAVSTRPEADRWRVDVHPITDYEDMECYASDGGSVFAIHGTDIVSVCKRKGDSTCGGKDLLESAVEHGGNKLDSYEGNHAFYTRCGFEPVAWTKFNPEWAPVGALPEDIVFYKYTGNKRLLTPEEAKKDVEAFKGTMEQMKYEVAQAYRDARL